MLLGDLDVQIAFRLVQYDGGSSMRPLSKSDYYGYLEIDVITNSWTYDPNTDALIKNNTQTDFERCSEDQLNDFLESTEGVKPLTRDITSFDIFCPNEPQLLKLLGTEDTAT